ncbi:hypothetical protein Plhal304r1_c065g0153321 [Plasmopara halstedii]
MIKVCVNEWYTRRGRILHTGTRSPENESITVCIFRILKMIFLIENISAEVCLFNEAAAIS